MNLEQINAWRQSQGLAPVVGKTDRAQKIRQDRNRQERAAENRALKQKRQGRSK